MTKWVYHEKSTYGWSHALTFFNKVHAYVGKTDHWGFAIAISFYERSLTIEFLNWYAGIEIWWSE